MKFDISIRCNNLQLIMVENLSVAGRRVEQGDPTVEKWEHRRKTRFQGPRPPLPILRHIIMSEVKDVPLRLPPVS